MTRASSSPPSSKRTTLLCRALGLKLNVVDGCISSDMATGKAEEIEEERRLLYVAMTRAKDQLALVVPHRF